MSEQHSPEWVKQAALKTVTTVELKFRHLARNTLWYLVMETCSQDVVRFLLDATETHLYEVAKNHSRAEIREPFDASWRTTALYLLSRLVASCRSRHPEYWNQDLWRRYWELLRSIDEGMPEGDRAYPPLDVTVTAELWRRSLARTWPSAS
jgi:hypothetical protein